MTALWAHVSQRCPQDCWDAPLERNTPRSARLSESGNSLLLLLDLSDHIGQGWLRQRHVYVALVVEASNKSTDFFLVPVLLPGTLAS